MLCDVFNEYCVIFQTMEFDECDDHEVKLHTSDLDESDWSSEMAPDNPLILNDSQEKMTVTGYERPS